MPTDITCDSSGIHPQRIMTAKEAAEILRVNASYITRLCQSGEIKAIKLSQGPRGHWRISRSALQEYIERGYELAQSGKPLSLVGTHDDYKPRIKPRQDKRPTPRLQDLI